MLAGCHKNRYQEMDNIFYINFYLNSIKAQLILASANLSEYDRAQNRQRAADGKWTKSTSVMSDVEKLNTFLDKNQKIWKADSSDRQKSISDIAKNLAETQNLVNGDEEIRKKISNELAPALSQKDDLTGIEIEERKRVISDLDDKLSELLPKNQVNRIITDLLLDIDELDYYAKWNGVKDKATVNLETILATVADIKNPKFADRLNEQATKTFHNIIDRFAPKKSIVAPMVITPNPNPNTTTKPVLTQDEQFYKEIEARVGKDRARIVTQQKTREQLKQVAENTQKLFNDIARVTVAGFETSAKKLASAGTGKDVQTMDEVVAELKKIGINVENAVTTFFEDNVEAYYENQSTKGKEQQKRVKAILDKAKQKVQIQKSVT
jgi:hypothetical protein